MQDELSQFERSQVWHLVPRPIDRLVIGTKWIFRNKLDKDRTITRNKARLVVQGYSQEEGIDYNDTFAPVVRLEAIRLLIAFAAYMEFTLHQMDIYVDDIIFGATTDKLSKEFAKLMGSEVEMSMMGELNFF
ncbi:uncharacterized mitochondrial protein AtMg00820-like [Nicotiana tomentosiformis]|uniref:uncharacterized mitochondrial protein AtMg00820-like n=1 Tax=Nicotiana tomentosiformis TaxID=4098 RepID=UPI00388C3ACE